MSAEPEQEASQHPRMCTGHIAIIDVLGWKGIWKRYGVGPVLHAVDVVRAVATEIDAQSAAFFKPLTPESMAYLIETWRPVAAQYGDDVLLEFDRRLQSARENLPRDPMLRVETVFLSDTLVVGSWTPSTWGPQVAENLAAVRRVQLCSAVARAQRDCALADVPLIFRGTVAPGEFLIDQHVILGQAVDDAAELMDEANAAIVWFVPPMFPVPQEQQVAQHLDYAVPLRDGRQVWAHAVNPFFGCYKREEIEPVFDGMLRAFGNSNKLDIVIKKQNTAAFLHLAREQWLAYLESPRGREILAAMAKVTPPQP